MAQAAALDAGRRIVVLACKICLEIGAVADVNNAVERLIDLLPDADWMFAEEIENCLKLHFDKSKQVIARAVQASEPDDQSAKSRAIGILRRIMSRAAAVSPSEAP